MSSFWDEQFDLQRRDPFFWWLAAQRLRRAGDLTFNAASAAISQFRDDPSAFTSTEYAMGRMNLDLDLTKTALFLYGLTLENLLKGILIARDALRFEKPDLLTHRLPDFFDEVGLTLDSNQRFVVEQIEILVVWRGRYPAPKKIEKWKLREDPKGRRHMPGSISNDDVGVVIALIDSAECLLVEARHAS